MRITVLFSAAAATLLLAATAQAFCGFYVARADTALYNRASQVVLVRDGNRTVITMANDYRGDASEFAMVIPVPTVIERGQVNVADMALVDHLDAYTAPRLVEYHDPDPCNRVEEDAAVRASRSLPEAAEMRKEAARARGVTVEASYTVGEYDIQVLSAEDSGSLLAWLGDNGYRLPAGAEPVLGSYLKHGLRFFVAKVNLEEQARLGFTKLRPLQVAYESPRFMLPIRLGTVNAQGEQELFVYALTRTGRVETTNYRSVRLPTGAELPEYVEGEFGDFYRAMFAEQTERERGRAVFLEYAWDMAWCDPCAADPLSADELRRLGVFWVAPVEQARDRRVAPQAQDVFVTRLHLRYDGKRFPEDLRFHETGDRSNFQGRYVIRHPWKGPVSCDASDYRAAVRKRQLEEAERLANLTGWKLEDILARIPGAEAPGGEVEPWWKKLWN